MLASKATALAISSSIANVAEDHKTGDVSWTDYVAVAGAFLSRIPGVQVLGGLLSLYPLAEDFGEWLGKKGYLDPIFEAIFGEIAAHELNYYLNNYDPSIIFEESEATLSPMSIDLNGDGVTSQSIEEEIFFDHDNNGMAENTGWISPDDGLLVLDRNSDGLINNGSELFGNNTQLTDGTNADNGYEALAELDSNGDGIIDRNDTAFNELRVWQDSNSDGVSQQEELLTLEEAGVVSIDTGYESVNIDDGDGNIIRQTSTAEMSDGTTGYNNDIAINIGNR